MNRADLPFSHPIGTWVMEIATYEAVALGHTWLGTEHLFLALSRLDAGYTARLIQDLHYQPKIVRAVVRTVAQKGAATAEQTGGLTTTPRMHQLLTLAQELAGTHPIGEQELLMALLQAGPGVAVRVLTTENDDIAALVLSVAQDTGPEGSISASFRNPSPQPPQPEQAAATLAILEHYGRNLTNEIRAGTRHPLVERKAINVLIGRALVHPERTAILLVGEPGVGKTTIVEGFAARLADEERRPVQEPLRGKQIIQIETARILADTAYRGDVEKRITDIIAVCLAHPEIILFIDEFHTLVGTAGGTNIADLLKSALSGGTLRIIGATTPPEYERFIATHPALERRIHVIRVDAMTVDETTVLLETLRPDMERRSAVTITDDAIAAAIRLSVRYQPQRHLPDKAMTLLNDAITQVKLPMVSFRAGEPEGNDDTTTARTITATLVRTALQETLGYPIDDDASGITTALAEMAPRLHRVIGGQDAAIATVAKALQTGYSVLHDVRRPRAVLLFGGTPGTGKTELALQVAAILYGAMAQSHLLRIDMSTMSERHTVSRLLGSPPGYVGYEQEGLLTGQLRRQPASVLIFDEIEKAHPDVQHALLPLFDAGTIVDAQGRNASGREAICIMTANLVPTAEAVASWGSDPITRADGYRGMLSGVLHPALVDRMDQVILFAPMTQAALEYVTDIHLNRLRQQLDDKHLSLEVETAAFAAIVAEAERAGGGARRIARTINETIAPLIAELQMQGRLTPSGRVLVQYHAERFAVTVEH